MNTRYLFLGAMFLLFLSCGKETSSSLYFKTFQVKQETKSAIEEEEIKIDTVLLFTGNNVAWYDAKTKEIRFKNAGLMAYIPCLAVFLDEKELFVLEVIPLIMSYRLDYPVLIYDLNGHYCFAKGYPEWGDWGDQLEERVENWKAFEPSWNIFIEQLKEEGRYIN